MTDLHTHILPGMDDGSRDAAESVELLRREREQGVDTVVLTPHFYRDRENADRFLRRRQAACQTLRRAYADGPPRLIMGAEVAWFPSLAAEERLDELCLGSSRYLLLELPFAPWPARLLDQVYDFAAETGLTPILAHVERYLPLQEKGKMDALLSMGFPMQMNADSLLPFWRRKKSFRLLRRGTWLIGSDCHDCTRRPPRLGPAAEILRAHLGETAAGRMLHWTDQEEKEAVTP